MKLTKYLLGLLTAAAFTACSNDENIPEINGPESEADSRFMSVTIRNANPNGRADDDYEEGLDFENDVTSLMFYFFKEDGSPFMVAADKNSYHVTDKKHITIPEAPGDKDMPNVEKILNAIIVLNATEAGDFADLKSMIVIANPSEGMPVKASKTDLKGIKTDYAASATNTPYNTTTKKPSGKFVMSSSTFGDGKFECETEIKPTDLHPTEDLAKANPVDVYVERTVAKIRLNTEWESGVTVVDDVTLGDKTGLKAVLLKKDRNAEGPITFNEKPVYVIFRGWCPTNVSTLGNLIKDVRSSWTLWAGWSHPDYHRSYWALNASGYALKNFTDNAATGRIGSISSSNGTTTTVEGDFFYVNENAGDDATTGHKNSFKPSAALSNRTQVYIAGVLVTIDENNKATEIDLAEWGGRKYVQSDLIKAMFAPVENQIWYCSDKKSSEDFNSWDYKTIGTDFIELTQGINVTGKASNTIQEGKRYLSYIQLKKELPTVALEGKLYKANPDYDKTVEGSRKYVEISREDANVILAGMPGAKVWGNGNTYYWVDIKHINKESKSDVDGKYGVVRNHIYEVLINNIFGLGTPILNPDSDTDTEIIIPEKPTPDEFYLAARINILSWRVVKQGVSLDW